MYLELGARYIFHKLQLTLEAENAAIITTLQRTIDLQFQLFGKFAVKLRDVLLRSNHQRIVNVHRNESHLVLVLEDSPLKVDVVIALTNLSEVLVPF